jgi:hypothetical protein
MPPEKPATVRSSLNHYIFPASYLACRHFAVEVRAALKTPGTRQRVMKEEIKKGRTSMKCGLL